MMMLERAEVSGGHGGINIRNFLQQKEVEATKQNEDKRKKPKPEEQEGMPQRQRHAGGIRDLFFSRVRA
jgi:hypothetical protein